MCFKAHTQIILSGLIQRIIKMIKIAIIDDEKEMSSILSNYVNKYAKEKNIDINMDIFQSSTDFLTNYSGYESYSWISKLKMISMEWKLLEDLD